MRNHLWTRKSWVLIAANITVRSRWRPSGTLVVLGPVSGSLSWATHAALSLALAQPALMAASPGGRTRAAVSVSVAFHGWRVHADTVWACLPPSATLSVPVPHHCSSTPESPNPQLLLPTSSPHRPPPPPFPDLSPSSLPPVRPPYNSARHRCRPRPPAVVVSLESASSFHPNATSAALQNRLALIPKHTKSVAAADNPPTRPPYHDSASTLTTSQQSIPSRLISLSLPSLITLPIRTATATLEDFAFHRHHHIVEEQRSTCPVVCVTVPRAFHNTSLATFRLHHRLCHTRVC